MIKTPYTKFNRGFTLIELLVVIAIISLLSSVVLAALNSARNNGTDATIKSNLNNARAQAELFYDVNNNSYSGVCAAPAFAGVKSIQEYVKVAATAYGYTTVGGDFLSGQGGNVAKATCHAIAGGWAAEVPLKSGGMWCVDSTGASKSEPSSSLPGGDVACD